MTRLWDKGDRLDTVIERFTVGRDPELDLRLLPYDVLGSAAHARMLAAVGLLSAEDERMLNEELRTIISLARKGEFSINREDEDCHTAIENRLTARLGEAGQRIHTGRSRNDQVIAALRLFAREAIIDIAFETARTAEKLCELAEEHREVPVPGYTHTRQAMPSTLGLLFDAFAESLADDLRWIEMAFKHVNRSPLGSASGFGVPLPLDRQLVADLLRFDSVQANVLAVQNDRGKTEHLVLECCAAPALDLARLASDLIWYSSDELGYVGLSKRVTTGSSIMPQKRNPDALELIRATGGKLRSRSAEIAAIYGPLGSGYHRDLQLTKEPFLEGIRAALDVLIVMQTVLGSLEVHEDRCRDAFDPAIGATDAMCGKIREGLPMRQAYREVSQNAAQSFSGEVTEAWRDRTYPGAPGGLDVSATRAFLEREQDWIHARREELDRAWNELLEI